jgi:hypothetical protein
MPASYQKNGLRFMYPENWQLVDDDVHSIPRIVSLQAPSGAFWSVDIHPFSVDLGELMEAFVETLRAEYRDIEFQTATEPIGAEDSIGYDVQFYCLDYVVAAQIRGIRHGHAAYVFTYQAEDREFDQMERVFRAITASLYRSLDDPDLEYSSEGDPERRDSEQADI